MLAQEAQRGNDALSRLTQEAFDLVIIDAEIPDVSFQDLFRLIRQTNGLEKMRVLVMLANEPADSRIAELISIGFLAVVTKAHGLTALVESIQKAIE